MTSVFFFFLDENILPRPFGWFWTHMQPNEVSHNHSSMHLSPLMQHYSVAFLHIINVLVFKPSHHPFSLAPFPGLPTLQFLIACSFWIPQVIKKWTVGRSGNKASASSISLHGRVATPWGFAECMFHFCRTFLPDIFCYSENCRYLFLLCFSAHGIPGML